MSNNKFIKSEIIYRRLFREYGNWEGKGEFMAEFGLERQSFYERKKKNTVDYDEIIGTFPDVNKDWLFSTDKESLENLSVKNSSTLEQFDYTHKINLLKEKINDEGVNKDAQEELLGFLEGRTEALSQELVEISFLMKRLRISMRKNHAD